MKRIHKDLIQENFIKFDPKGMRNVILDFPKQFSFVGEICYQDTALAYNKKRISNIIICGMGGSALPGNVLKSANSALNFTKLPIIIHRDYGLAKETNQDSLIFCISYSGNTEETISAFNEAKKRKLKICVVASGGTLINLAKRNQIPFIKVPQGIQPRCALGYQFVALVQLLLKIGIIKSLDKNLFNLADNLDARVFENKGKELAKKLMNSVLVIYSSSKWGAISKIWKIKFNENSKLPSFFNFFPELNHNEMVGMGETKIKDAKKIFKFLFLIDSDGDSKRILKRMKIMGKIFKNKGFKIFFIDLAKITKRANKNQKSLYFFEKFFSAILLGDWVSYYLAINQGIDPTPVNLVEEFKKKIAR